MARNTKNDADVLDSTLEAEAESERKAMEASKVEQQEREHISKWVDRIRQARAHDKDARDRWADDRKVARGESNFLVSTNLIGSIMEVIAAFLYARNPDLNIRPSPSAPKMDDAGQDMTKVWRALSDTLEVIVSRLLYNAGLKRVAKRWVRGAMTVGVAWIKAAMQTRTERDPLTEKQINDLQDNMARLAVLKSQVEGDSDDENDIKYDQMRSQIKALQGGLEREVAEGIVLDLMAPEDVIVAPQCGEIENYLASPWIAFDMYKEKDEALRITGWKGKDAEALKTANLYMQRPRKGENEENRSTATQWVSMGNSENDENESSDGFYRFTEIWSLNDGVVYTIIDGVNDKWARPSYAPRTGARFYPNFLLAFHPVDGERYPQSDVAQLKSLQEEYSRVRSSYAEHRRRAIPGVIFDKAQVVEESVKRIEDATTQEYLGIDLVYPETDIRTVFTPKLYNQVDAALYNTMAITQDMEKVSGAQDALQGSVQVEKTATEAQIQEAGRGARIGARLDSLEDALTELCEYVTQLALQTMDKADAMRYAGPSAVWIDMSTDEALTLFNISIKAGSTGKPKAASDREAWGTLMPLIQGLIDRIGNARIQGQEWAAKPWVALLEETGKRLDDPLEVEKFLPSPPPEYLESANQPAKPTPMEESEIELNEARALKEMATAVEKVPPLFLGPVIEHLNGEGRGEINEEAVPMESVPSAPNPLPPGIN